jgi:hypothetical protein
VTGHPGGCSVTTVVGAFADFSRVPKDVLEHAQHRGSETHRICGVLARGLPFLGRIPGDLAGRILSFQNWLETAVEQVYAVENRLHHPTMGYHGQPDLVLLVRGDKLPSVADLKTPLAASPTWNGQMAGYRELVNVNRDKLMLPGPVGRTFSVRLHPDGGPVKITEYTDDARDLQAFLCALTAYRYFRGEDT